MRIAGLTNEGLTEFLRFLHFCEGWRKSATVKGLGRVVTLHVHGGAVPGPPPFAAEEARRLRWSEPLALLHATSRVEPDAWRSRVKELTRHILTRLPGTPG